MLTQKFGSKPSWKNRLILLAILLLAFVLRIIAIDRIPPGLSHDEAYNGVTAMQVLDGQRLIFFEINKGIEPLIIYLEALAFYAFGIGPVPMRLVNIICGLLTVALIYPLAARLFNRRVALLAMAGLAVSFWAIFTSRLALRAVTLPPLLMLTLYFLWRGLTSSQKSVASSQKSLFGTQKLLAQSSISTLVFFALSGLAAGVAMYTYLSSRFVPLLIITIVGYQLWRRQITKWHGLGLLLLGLIWAVILAPLGQYFLEHADSFTERSSQVSTIPYALNGDFGPLIRNILGTLGMFTFHGDETARYNLNGRPVFDWVNGLFFYIGLGVALLRLRRSPDLAGPAVLLLFWLLVMLLPGFITDDSPHFLRTIGVMPAVYILWALGLASAYERISKWRIANGEWRMTNGVSLRPTPHASRLTLHASVRSLPLGRFILHPFDFAQDKPSSLRLRSGQAFILLLILLTTLHTLYDYFGRWAADPEARYIYGADMAEVAGYVNATRTEGLTAISAEYYRDLDPFRLTLHSHGQPPFVIWFDGRQTLAFPPPNSGLSPRYIFPASAPPADNWQPFLQPSPAESGREYRLYRLRDAVAISQAQNAAFSTGNTLGVNINNDLILSAYQVLGSVVSGGKFEVLLAWQALRTLPPGADYTFLIQLQDSQGHVWAEADGNGYPPSDWQPGVQGLQLLLLRLPGDLPPRTYHLTVQVIDRQTGQALATPAGNLVTPLASLRGQLAQSPRSIDPATLPNPTQVSPTTAREITLRGYEVKNPITRPGEALTLTLHWQVLQQPQQNYRLEFYLVNKDDPAPEARYRWPAIEPINGEWPTSQWPANYWFQDRVSLPLGADIPRGQFILQVAWRAEDIPPAQSSDTPKTFSGFELGAVTITE
jgi:4-amino-4-deoxy-L-arabinose transferase-like glycosyltransferase